MFVSEGTLISGPRQLIKFLVFRFKRITLSAVKNETKMHQFLISLCPSSRRGHKDSKTHPTFYFSMILSQVMAIWKNAIFSVQRGHLIRQLYYITFPINYLPIKIGKKSPLSLVLIFWHGALSSVGVVTNSTFAPLCNKKRNFVVPVHDARLPGLGSSITTILS